MLLKALDMDADCFFFGSHVFDKIPVSGYFAGKERIISQLETEMAKMPASELDTVWQRGSI